MSIRYRSVLATLGGYLFNLSAYYKFDVNANDFSGNALNGTTGSIVTYGSAGIIGNSADFPTRSDINNNIIVNNNALLEMYNGSNDLPFSISIWVRPTTEWVNNNFEFILNKRNISSTGEYQIIKNSDKIEFRLFGNNLSSVFLVSSVVKSNITANAWNLITVTYSGNASNTGMNLYVNGSLPAQTKFSGGVYTKMSGSNNVIFGRSFNNIFNSFIGQLDEAYIWKNRELTASEVADIYAKGLAGQTLI